jgi:hypothetical protein
MKNIYFLILPTFFFSCSAGIRYTGTQFPQTKEVDVYVTESAIERPFTYMGKAYLTLGIANPEAIQRKSVKKAKEKGADAILLFDYPAPVTGINANSYYRSDSVGRSLITTGSTSVQQTSSQSFAIYFIKYK